MLFKTDPKTWQNQSLAEYYFRVVTQSYSPRISTKSYYPRFFQECEKANRRTRDSNVKTFQVDVNDLPELLRTRSSTIF